MLPVPDSFPVPAMRVITPDYYEQPVIRYTCAGCSTILEAAPSDARYAEAGYYLICPVCKETTDSPFLNPTPTQS